MLEIALVNLEVDENGLYTATQGAELNYIKNILGRGKGKCFEYLEKNLPNLYDIADEILSLSEEKIIFYLTKQNYKLVEEIATVINEEDEDIQLVGVFNEDEVAAIDNLEMMETFNIESFIKLAVSSNNIETNIFSLENLEEIENVNLKLVFDNKFLGSELINKNLEFLNNLEKEIKVSVYYNEIEMLASEEINEFIDSLKQYKNLVLEVKINTKASLDSKEINEFIDNEIEYISFDISEDLTQLNKLNLTNKRVNILLDDSISLEYEKLIEANELKAWKCDKQGHCRCIKIKTSTSVKNLPIENGVAMFYQGTYPDVALNNTVKHVRVKGSISRENLKELDKLVSVNHALILEKENYSKDNLLGFSKHIHLLEKNDGSVKIEFDEGAFSNKYKKFNYKEVARKNEEETEEFLLEINDDDDIIQLLNDILTFKNTGSIPNYMTKGILKNACRTACKGKCQLNAIPKLEVGEKGDLYSCGSDISIGKLGDDSFEVMNNIYISSNKEGLKRKCSSCEVKNICPSCKMLPKEMSREMYCKLMKETKGIDRFIIGSMVLKILLENTKVFENVNRESIHIISEEVKDTFSGENKSTGNLRANAASVLIKLENEYLLFSLMTSEIISISTVVAYVLQGLMKGYSIAEIKEYSKKELEENMDELIIEASEKLEELNIV